MRHRGGNSILFIVLAKWPPNSMAIVLMQHLMKKKFSGVRETGIGNWHAGNNPDHRAIACMRKHGVAMKHYARQIKKSDFTYYDYIIGMDHENMNDLKSIAPKDSTAKTDLWGSFDPEKELIIEDPYYDDGDEGFEKCYAQCLRCSNGFLDTLDSY
ncbi:unnamed protein product, partial [Meganyctiphanes norvegica]